MKRYKKLLFLFSFICTLLITIDNINLRAETKQLKEIVNDFPEIEEKTECYKDCISNKEKNDFIISDEEIEELVIDEDNLLSKEDKEYFCEKIKLLPVNVFNMFKRENGKIYIVSDINQYYYEKENTVQAFYRNTYLHDESGNVTYKYEIYLDDNSITAITHEFGHFTYDYVNLNTKYFDTADFKQKSATAFTNERKYFATCDNNELYSMTDSKEYYAEMFSYFCNTKWKEKENLEETRNFLIELVQQI